MKAGWEVKPLGEVCEKITDGTHHSPKKTSAVRKAGYFPYVTSKNIRNGVLDKTKITYVDPDFHEGVYSRCAPEFGDVLLTKDGSNTGQVTLNTFDEPISLLSSVCLIKPNHDQLLAQYIVYYLQSDEGFENLTGQMTGAAIRRIILKNIKTSAIPIPPLEEQKQIVAVLDAAFEGLTRAKENAEANLQNARELFESHLAGVFSGDIEGWTPCTVGDVLTLQRGFDITKKDQRSGKIPVVSSGGIKSYHDESKCAAPGVVIGRKGSIGTVHFIEDDYWPHDTTLWIKDFKGNEPRLTAYLLKGIRLSELDTGTANPSLNRNIVHPLSIFWPETLDQSKIANELDQLADICREAETQYLTKLTDIADLRQSLLQKAFAGELT